MANLMDIKAIGAWQSALEVDPKGAADLVRWSLEHDIPEERLLRKDHLQFRSALEFREWFARLRGESKSH